MLWPIVLPFKITFCIVAGFVTAAVLLSPLFKWKLGKTVLVSVFIGLLAFAPICAGIGSILDSRRFGVFHYDTYSEVQDFRIERYLPPKAREITLDKSAMGHRAKYSITFDELTEYLDALWIKSNGRSAVPRDQLNDGEKETSDRFEHRFEGLDWAMPETALHFHSPVQSDGGGADYFFDAKTNTVFQHAGYW